ncbi:hypothetical protein Daura_33725 [Dactylosporangium aurantiacum]|uniref:Uncharacterized protein n=1 Tax=Dactylosporangium aurantiacum TaxID=35754 RepID=A0A9Q9I942_9ACTN|nr:hypothetical protein [Dactylosporangium aurantiacum]MDG6105155.1 hypothetical protein [Dactylosporangium aurantiacum]UWZ51677.1 hypothetical protein Daura_33725 [Dactylosporangium aurantiacum]
MTIIPQTQVLWLATAADEEIHAGRVIGWETEHVQPVPLVAWTDETGLLSRVGTPVNPVVWLGDTRGEVIESAQREIRQPAALR